MAVADHRRRGMEFGYYRGLDGLRALAVCSVLLYHGGVSWAGGGFLGVEAFFVLSGFLITSLLIAEWLGTSGIAIQSFWARRARRLLPALLCVLSVVGIYYVMAGPGKAIPGLKNDGLATLLYVGNWHQIAVGNSYFFANGPISPLNHTWSLAIEEQFYIVWPLVLVGILWLGGRRRAGRNVRSHRQLIPLLALTTFLALASALDSVLQLRGGLGLSRVYYGTDTRAAGLLVGAALAIGLTLSGGRTRNDLTVGRARNSGRLAGWVATAALLAVLAAMHFAGEGSLWLYPAGLLGLDVAVALVIAAVVICPSSLVGRLFSLSPLRAIGKISYGLYLWHFPLFLWLDTASTGLNGAALLGLRLALTLFVSIASFFLIEQPVRQRRLPRWLVRGLAPVGAAAAFLTLQLGPTVGSPSFALAATPALRSSTQFARTQTTCRVRLKDTKHYGLSPLPVRQAPSVEINWLIHGVTAWSGTSHLTFHTCPPTRVLLVGDSLAFTLGVGVMYDEQSYGVELADDAILGCGYGNRGKLFTIFGAWQPPPTGCASALQQWARDEQAFRPQAVVFELGYRDEFDWDWRGRTVHLGQRAYDTYLQTQIDRYVRVLSRNKTAVLLLTVPWAQARDLPNGAPQPESSQARHVLINSMLASAARRYGNQVRVLAIDRFISPHNHYQINVDGHQCRSDGLHFTLYCSSLLGHDILSEVQTMLPSTGAG